MSRSENLYNILMDNTVLSHFFKPALTALSKVPHRIVHSASLPMNMFMLASCLRHLQGQKSMREQLQHLFHLTDEEQMPIARSSYSDALNSEARATVVQQVVTELAVLAKEKLPDRLKDIPEISSRNIYAVDGSYQEESAHYTRVTPKDGGTDNHKGHMMLTFYDVRLGAPIGARIETSSRHEVLVLKDELIAKDSCFKKLKNALFVVDRAFIHASFWDSMKTKSNTTMITREKNNFVYTYQIARKLESNEINEGVTLDEEVGLQSSTSAWRRITYKAPNGNDYTFITNDFTLSPGVVAFLYLRRWDEEKCFDTWKNDFSSSKAWAKSKSGIYQQVLFVIMTTLLTKMFSQYHENVLGVDDEKCFNKQEILSDSKVKAGKERRPWYQSLYRATAKTSKQIIRFLKMCFLKKSCPSLYRRELKPMFLCYL
jgi:Transposase DDE domain